MFNLWVLLSRDNSSPGNEREVSLSNITLKCREKVFSLFLICLFFCTFIKLHYLHGSDHHTDFYVFTLVIFVKY